MADYYINSDRGKELANSLRAGDMAEASDGSLWRKEADGSISVIKNGQTMTGRVGVSAPAVSAAPETPPLDPTPTVETPALDAARQSDPAYSLQQKSAAQEQQVLASEKAKQATENVTSGLTQEPISDDLLAQAIQQASKPESYTIGSAKGVLMTDKMQNAGDMAEAADGSLWKRNEDGSISVTKNGKTYTANVDRAAAKQDPQWAVLTAPPVEEEEESGKKSKKKSSGTSSGSTGTAIYSAAPTTSVQKTTTQTAVQTASVSKSGDVATLRKKAATAQKNMGDLARQISAAKMRGKDTAALEAKYAEAKDSYDKASAQVTAAKAPKNEGPTLLEAATRAPEKRAAVQKEAWRSLPTVADADRFSINKAADAQTREAEQQFFASARRELQQNAWRSLPTVQDSDRFGIPSQTDSLMQQAIAKTPRTLSGKPYLPENDGGFSHSSGSTERQNVLERIGNAALGGLMQSGGTSMDAAGAMYQAGQGGRNTTYNESRAWFQDQLDSELRTLNSMLLENRDNPGTYTQAEIKNQRRIIAEAQARVNAFALTQDAQEQSGELARDLAADVSNAGASRVEQSKRGASKLGSMALDALASAAQSGADMATNALLGTSGSMLPFAFRAFGGGTQQARNDGATLGQQLAYGGTMAAKEVFTEKMFNIAGLQSKAYGKGSFDDYVEKAVAGAVDKLASTDVGKRLLGGAAQFMTSAAGEGLEELIGDWMEWQLPRIYGKDPDSAKDVAVNSLYDFLVGAISGVMGNLTTPGQFTNYDINEHLGGSQGQQVNRQLTQDELLDAAMQAANRGEMLTGPVQAANQTTQQTTQGTAERGADGVITGSETNKNAPAYTETENTAVNDNPAVHTPQEQAVIEAYKDSVDENLAQFYQYAKNDQRAGKYTLNKVSERAADDIRNLTGQDVDGFKTTLDARQAWHINNDHGANGKSDQSMANDTDVARMQYVLDNYDNAAYGGTTDAYWEPKANGKNRRSPVVVFSKKVNGTYYVVEATPVTKAQSVYVVSAYMLEPGRTPFGRASRNNTGAATQLPDANASWFTANTDSANMAPNANVAQPGKSVNQNVSANDMGAMRSQFESVPKQSQTQSNTIGSMEADWNVPESQRTTIMYDTIPEAKSLDNARLRLAQDYAGEMAELRGKHNWSGEEVDMGMTILDNYRRAAEQTGDWTEYSNWRKEVSAHGTAAGQALQAYAKYSRQTGGGIVADASAALERAAKKTNKAEIMNRVNTLAQQYDAAVGTGQENVKVNVNGLVDIIKSASTVRKTGTLIGNKTPPIVNWAMNRIANYARSEAQSGGGSNLDFLKTFAANSIYNIAADTQTVSAGEKVKTYRRQGMLSKVATVMRNLVSNNGFDPLDSVARNISVPLDMLVSKFTGTRSVAGDASWFSAAKRKGSMDGLAKSAMQVGLDVDTSGTIGKYESTSNRTFKMSGGVFSKLMSTWEAVEGYLLNSTDEFQKGGIEASVQHGIDRLYEKGKIKDDSLRDAGKQEARYRTFQDDTALSKAVTGFRSGINEAHLGDVGVGDVALTFAQVPANLASRSIEYSPSGSVSALVDFANLFIDAKSGKMTAAKQAKAVQAVGRALTGTGLIALSAVGHMAGWLVVSGDDDDKNKSALDKLLGLNGTQLNVNALLRHIRGESTEFQEGDILISIGFMDPLNALFTTGVLVAEDYKEAHAQGKKLTFGQVVGDSFLGAYQAVMEMPLISDLRDIAQNYQYSSGEKFYQKAGDALQKYAASQVASLIPNSIRGIAQGLDDTERNAYSSDNVWQQAVDNAKASIPGLRETLPAKTDVWGNPVKNEGGVRNFMNRNINPGNITTYKTDAVSSEIEKISEATGASLYPDRTAPRSIKVDGEAVSLTFEQRSMYQKAYGDAYSAAVTSLMSDKNYKAMPDSMKAEILKQAKDVATEQARDSLGVGYEVKTSAQKVLEKSGADRANALISAAVKSQHYLSPETQEQRSKVDQQFAGADYVGLSDEIVDSAKEKADTYFTAVEAAKYGGELTEAQKELSGKSSKELARYFMDEAINAKIKGSDGETKFDKALAAYQKDELNDTLALAVLSDDAVQAYDRYGRSAGVTPEMMLIASSARANIKDETDEDGKVTNSAKDQFNAWLDKQWISGTTKRWTEDQKNAVRMAFYKDASTTYSYLSEQLRKGNINTATAKSELSTTYQSGWTHNVKDTGAKMADYVDAIVEYENRPSSEELEDMGYSKVWVWFCDYLNTTDLTREQKYAMAISIKKNDYAESTMKKIWDRLR